MKENQLKIKVFLLRAMDISLLIAVFSFGIYSILYSEQKNFMATITLVGLLLVNQIGKITANKIAAMNADIEKQKRLDKKYTI